MADYWEINGIEKPQAVVVCAACKHIIHDLILAGPRHWDIIMRGQYESLDLDIPRKAHFWEQGFINQFGEFLTRKEAMKVAKEAGQKIDIEVGCRGDTENLYSEALY